MSGQHVFVTAEHDRDVPDLVMTAARSRLAAGGIVIVAVDQGQHARMREEFGHTPDLILADRHDPTSTPLSRLVDSQLVVETGGWPLGRPVDLIHHVAPVSPGQWWDWMRVECVVTAAMAINSQHCVYSQQDFNTKQLAQVRDTHGLIGLDGAARVNPEAVDPQAMLHELLRQPVTLPAGPATTVLYNPSVISARDAALGAALDAHIGEDAAAALLFATTETVANAWEHGRAPTQLTLWVVPGRVHLVVFDSGDGPTDLAVGLDRNRGEATGLWLAHQLLDIRHELTASGYAVHLTAATSKTGMII